VKLFADDLTLRPGLLLVYPFEHEGEHTVPDTDKLIYLDHHWDDTFGYAFGTVLKVASDVTKVAPGDFVYFERAAYIAWRDGDGDELLFVNQEDVQAKIVPGDYEVAAKGVGQDEDRVERDAA